MLRRIKDEVECALPPRMETRINCPLSEMQTFWYRRLLLRHASVLQDTEGAVSKRQRGWVWLVCRLAMPACCTT